MEQGYLNEKRKNDTETCDESIPVATEEVRKGNERRGASCSSSERKASPSGGERAGGNLHPARASPPCDSLRRAYEDLEGAGLSHPGF